MSNQSRLTAAVVNAGSVVPEPINWLWPGRIPHGQLTLLVGEPGTGKSLLAAELAACVTTGSAWPDQSEQATSEQSPPAVETQSRRADPDEPMRPWDTNPIFATPPPAGVPVHDGDVVITSPEDHPSQVLLPRLAAAGAVLDRVAILCGTVREGASTTSAAPLQLPDDIGVLWSPIIGVRKVRLLVLDPLHALLSPAAQCNPAILSGLLAELANRARRFNVTIVATVHLAKSARSRALYRVRGSICLTAAARAAHLLTIDPDDRNRRILAPLKTVYGAPAEPLAFRIAERDAGDAAPYVVWEKEPARPPAELMDLATELGSALSEACAWLADLLGSGSRPAREVLAAAHEVGIPRATLFRAKRLLGVRSKRLREEWIWEGRGLRVED